MATIPKTREQLEAYIKAMEDQVAHCASVARSLADTCEYLAESINSLAHTLETEAVPDDDDVDEEISTTYPPS